MKTSPVTARTLPVISFALWFLVLALLSGATVYAGEATTTYPGKLGIVKAKNLTGQERAVEARFAAYLEANTDEAIKIYRAKYGKEINTDNVRELSKDFAPGGMDSDDRQTRAARSRWSAAVQEPASAFAREIYRRVLRSAPETNQRAQVVFTAGGAGVGKTTSINQIAGFNKAVEAAEIVYDTTLSSLGSSTARVALALDAGRMVSIVFVYRDPVDSFVGGVLPRAERNGRTLPLDAFIDTHLGAPAVLLKLAEMYKGDKRMEIAVIDNSRGLGQATVTDLAFISAVGAKYSRQELKEKLSKALENAYEKGKRGEKNGISEVVYKAIKGASS
jgi:hypothetical protein